MPDVLKRYFAPKAWIHGAWAKDVLLTVASNGTWASIETQSSAEQRRDATHLRGPVLPGIVNAHSHAFQRAMAGMAERVIGSAGHNQDNFWSWRDRMYSAAQRITPQQLEAIAALLYAELLQAGYTQVCEFHYLHNDLQGQSYANPLEMSLALIRAADRVGIGITLLPTLYMRSGFSTHSLRDDQQRFASTPASILQLCEGIEKQLGSHLVNTGLALHSLRAVGQGALQEVAAHAKASSMPIHIHVAEQTAEVADCMSTHGQRPIEWLLNHTGLDSHWNLVHATHTTPAELQGVKNSGASIVLCPSTEANLGDGVFDLPNYARMQGNWSIGSDSHVMAGAASDGSDQTSTAAALFNAALAGGSAACGLPMGGIALGNRADFSVIDSTSPALLGIPKEALLDAMIFSSPDARLTDVMVAGKPVVQAGRGEDWAHLAKDFSDAMHALWAQSS
jgi:formimidoylglutamate deiminase